jgi:hypothetical protein
MPFRHVLNPATQASSIRKPYNTFNENIQKRTAGVNVVKKNKRWGAFVPQTTVTSATAISGSIANIVFLNCH